ncbi:MAG: fumarylacetoacetate hydrolase family protein [Bacteroidia bacterium]|jgi:2-keto-4-pentenoate hydratase/2-oxohepta-3-ene-1,7-dioic acid hydratase in catechol pathway|uniref:fumarylacetoacetate hydrolase family protein n=1 Tax=Candidatus Pollutiaquabacter sp. TaxID=3416354 RepID=UPI001A6037E0|nr:fumarylacetoacetate hydrolase family protein [Bacteroidota bacterium]MBL7947961.1 fumarylacetoacetate hydrolase family protein [Bacteroidia bacterium]MBP6009210.1 fumarylacetoacetate hydrolase family protein [Bacteroidia bacterium]MBP7270225.1 fumarylacetoacetate hydrolase family protein [Bacteroidia bacterium]MBP7436533.1 fumarylacetoacetate hydrolase family protein [Bacteroidia bacterium]
MKILCIGRNYAEHAAELKNDIPAEPVFFLKPDTALLPPGQAFYLPDFSNDIHHEVELVLRIGKEGKHIQEEFASRYIDGITVGVDFTARDVQQRQKEKGLPWEPAKAFDHSAPVGRIVPFESFLGNDAIHFSLTRNGQEVQRGDSSLMLFPFNRILAHLSRYITLRKGDLIFTGTPKGVGAVAAGDTLEAFLEGESLLRFDVK